MITCDGGIVYIGSSRLIIEVLSIRENCPCFSFSFNFEVLPIKNL